MLDQMAISFQRAFFVVVVQALILKQNKLSLQVGQHRGEDFPKQIVFS